MVMPSTTEERVQQALRKLVGLELTAIARSADLRGFHFGELRPYRDRTVGELALHVQCAWRIESPGGVLTGRSDLRQPALDLWGDDFKRWDYERDGNLQDKRIAEWLGHHDPRPGDVPGSEAPARCPGCARDTVRRGRDRLLGGLSPHPVSRRQRRRGLAPVPAGRR